MNLGNVRKRLDRLEEMHKAQIEAAALANAPTPEPSREEKERGTLDVLWLRRHLQGFTSQETAEFNRLRSLYPDHVSADDDADINPDEMSPEEREKRVKENWKKCQAEMKSLFVSQGK